MRGKGLEQLPFSVVNILELVQKQVLKGFERHESLLRMGK
jgi:hypothetical protein